MDSRRGGWWPDRCAVDGWVAGGWKNGKGEWMGGMEGWQIDGQRHRLALYVKAQEM